MFLYRIGFQVVMGELSAFFLKAADELRAQDRVAAAASLQAMAELGLPSELFTGLLQQLSELLPPLGQTDQCLGNLKNFLQASRSPQAWLALFEREREALHTLMRVFASSQAMATALIADPEAFDLLRLTGGQTVAGSVLQDEILAQVQATSDSRGAMRILREYRQRESMRIAFGQLFSGHSVDIVSGQLSELVEAILQAAVWSARREVESRFAAPRRADGAWLAFCVLALGQLGGSELDFSDKLELLMIHESVPPIRHVSARPQPSRSDLGNVAGTNGAAGNHALRASDYFQSLGQTLVRILTEATDQGSFFTIDLRMRPLADQGPLVPSFDEARNYYDSTGRTWERQSFVKARPVGGDLALGSDFLADLQAWIYRRYLTSADRTGLAALKRRIARSKPLTKPDGPAVSHLVEIDESVRQIEVVTQFLQLLYGGDDPSVRSTNTLQALERLQIAGYLTVQDASTLGESYRWLRGLVQRVQIAGDGLSKGSAPSLLSERLIDLTKLAKVQSTQRELIQQLLQKALPDDDDVSAEFELIVDPQPDPAAIHAVLSPYGFASSSNAYRRLQNMAVESTPFLSTRRCRHVFAEIAPQLLAAIAATPCPDATLSSLADVSESLGGKAGLWELFSAYPATLDLCVRLCACSPYLTSILTSNPGMIDELLDSLMLERLPSHEELSEELALLCHGVADIDPIVHSFKNSMHLRVGVRDLLGKATIAQTHRTLASIAEVCLEQVIVHEFHRLVHQIGVPMRSYDDGTQVAAEMVVLAVGKLGGGEPNYHSDVDVIFLFDVEGHTCSLLPNRRFEPTTNRHFFNQLCQRIIHAVTSTASSGRLYDMDVHWRPLGRSGELAITIDDLRRYFARGGGEVGERQALCKARPIWGSPQVQRDAMKCVHEVLMLEPTDYAEFVHDTQQHDRDDLLDSSRELPAIGTERCAAHIAAQLLDARLKLQQGSGPFNLKRGVGGTMDVESVVQLLQLLYSHAHPQILVPGTVEALHHLAQANLMGLLTAQQLASDYEFLRRVESGIRLMNMSARHELPSDELTLSRLAFLLRYPTGSDRNQAHALIDDCETTRQRIRQVFLGVFAKVQTLPE